MATYKKLIKDRGFTAFLATQFCGAFNDNAYKTVVSLMVLDEAVKQSNLLSLAAIVFLIPSLCFSGYAGFIADRFSKRVVIRVTKLMEIAAMALTFIVLPLDSYPLLLLVLFLMASQTAFFSPAKYGLVPEITTAEQLSRANALLYMATFIAIILGTATGGLLMFLFRQQTVYISIALLLFALCGYCCSLFISKKSYPSTQQAYRLNPWAEIRNGLQSLQQKRLLLIVALTISLYWGLGMAVQLNLFLYGRFQLFAGMSYETGDLGLALLNVVIACGVASGALLAGYFSGDRIEVGIAPLGLLGTAATLAALGHYAHSLPVVYSVGFLLGFASGVMIVPLNALLQHLPAATEKGRVIATNNFFNALAMIYAAILISWLHDGLHLSAAEIFMVLAAMALLSGIGLLFYMPTGFIDLLLWTLRVLCYRVHVSGREHLPQQGAALVVCNHISLLDGGFLCQLIPRRVRFLIYKPYYESIFLHWAFAGLHAIPVESGNSAVVNKAITQARKALAAGHVVCIFAEGAVSRTGHLLPFRPGLQSILKNRQVPVIPAHIDHLWDSVFALKKQRFPVWQRWRWRRRVSVQFGAALASSSQAWQVRAAVLELGFTAQRQAEYFQQSLATRLLQVAKKHASKTIIIDYQGEHYCYRQFMVAVLRYSYVLKTVSSAQQEIAVWLAPGKECYFVNAAIALAGCVAVNIPWRQSDFAVADFLQQRHITVLFSHINNSESKQLHKGITVLAVETCGESIPVLHKMAARCYAGLPLALLTRLLGRVSRAEQAAAVVLQSEQTTATWSFSHRAINNKVAALAQVVALSSEDRLLHSLPATTALGLTGVLWAPLLMAVPIVTVAASNNAETVWAAMQKEKVSILLHSREFMRQQLLSAATTSLPALRTVFMPATTAAEDALLQQLRAQLHAAVFVGFGCSATASVVAVNLPNRETGKSAVQLGQKNNSVGCPLPGIRVKIVHADTGEECAVAEQGVIHILDHSLCLQHCLAATDIGYAEPTWYNSGQRGWLDKDGFLYWLAP